MKEEVGGGGKSRGVPTDGEELHSLLHSLGDQELQHFPVPDPLGTDFSLNSAPLLIPGAPLLVSVVISSYFLANFSTNSNILCMHANIVSGCKPKIHEQF